MIVYSFDLLCRYLLVLEHLIINQDQQTTTNHKKHKSLSSPNTRHIDWSINERDEILFLFTTFLQLDLRQFWYETERLEDQPIGKSVDIDSLFLIKKKSFDLVPLLMFV